MSKKGIISREEQKQIMLKMLKYVDAICRKNNIKYSLIGGSLIGAIRHHGYIPWDDDVDLILTKDNYDKLKHILDKSSGRYQTMKRGKGGERFNFMKLVDTRTMLSEKGQLKDDPNYGIFLDIFCFYPTSNDKKRQRKHYRMIKFMISLSVREKVDLRNDSIKKNMRRIIKNTVSKIFGYKNINMVFDIIMNKYLDIDSDYLVSNWPINSFEREIQLKKNTQEYIDSKFENITVMIFKNYDEILKITFGNYMELPPKSERVAKHNFVMRWRMK